MSLVPDAGYIGPAMPVIRCFMSSPESPAGMRENDMPLISVQGRLIRASGATGFRADARGRQAKMLAKQSACLQERETIKRPWTEITTSSS